MEIRTVQPSEPVAQAVRFFCSPMSSCATGAGLLVDGGASLYPMEPEDT